MPDTRELFSAKNPPPRPQDDVLLSGPDSAMTNLDVRRIACLPYVLPEATLRASLDLALRENPVLTGRLVSAEDNRTLLRCNNKGLLLVVEHNDAPMPDYGYHNSSRKHINRYIAGLSSNKIDKDRPLVSVQINYFRDGMIIGFSNDHSVMDGNIAWDFLNRWGDYTREPQQPAKSYSLDRTKSRPHEGVVRTEPATRHARLTPLSKWGKSKLFAGLALGRIRLATRQFHLPEQRLAELKSDISAQLSDGEWISTLDVATGLLLQFFSLSCTEDDFTAHMIYNLRSLPGSHFPANYVGNASITRSCTLPTGDASITLADCARSVRQVALGISQEDVQQDLAYMNYMHDRDEKRSLYNDSMLAQRTANGYLVNNYARFPAYGIDFGPGKPSWCDYPTVILPRHAVILPDPNDDGVTVQMTLPKKEMQRVLDLPKDVRQFETAFSA
jgi:hypothetical protein